MHNMVIIRGQTTCTCQTTNTRPWQARGIEDHNDQEEHKIMAINKKHKTMTINKNTRSQ